MITLFTKRHKNRILFIYESFSGSNSRALWKFADDAARAKYEMCLYKDSCDEGKGLAHFVSKHRLIASAQLIITTHASYKPSRKHIHLQLWHGGSNKKIGVMETAGKKGRFVPPKAWLKVDYIMSYSETCTTFLNACMPTNPNKYIITGAPRNDFLFSADGRANLRKIFGDKVSDGKLIFFLPTFRDYCGQKQGDRNYDNLFGFKDFAAEEFYDFLKKNNCQLIFKPHPHEEALILEYLGGHSLDNVLIIRNDDLVANDFDFYELLNAADLLITDYSSTYYDYLLLERPIIFAPVDLESYQAGRGFLVESFESWAPGPKVFDQQALQDEISKCLGDENYYGEKRTWLRNLQHRYKDGESSRRLWKFIDAVLTERK
ncbi:MAG: CDP-glycerol glycerophosphotransferase family protein [Victivallaceae bacterium]|nr:CDP-glycerol glycerophosphotransferase family protein [Victivallaceae bacterium]